MISIRQANANDEEAIWAILKPMIRIGERTRSCWELISCGRINGAGGSHVANCGYVTAPFATGEAWPARCVVIASSGSGWRIRAGQFNLGVNSIDRAVKVRQRFGFEIVGTLPKAFLHPTLRYLDAYVMFQSLE